MDEEVKIKPMEAKKKETATVVDPNELFELEANVVKLNAKKNQLEKRIGDLGEEERGLKNLLRK